MENWKEGLALVFANRKYSALFVVLFAVLTPVYAVLTDIVILSPLALNPGIRPLETALVFCVSVLASLGFTIAAFQIFEAHSISKKSLGGSVLGAGAGGTVLATFASACTVCQPIWLFWLGLGSATAFLADYGIYIMLASMAILLYSIDSGLAAITHGCAVKPKRKR
ncbi:MAG: hypothetical protein WCT52_01865 [Candidatus Micrarchaeia archaeon]